MRALLLTACALIVTASAAAAPSIRIVPLQGGLTIAATPSVAGARHVRLALTLRYQMQCGYPGAGPLVVTLPDAEQVPASFPAGSVLLEGKALAAKVSGSQVTVVIPTRKGIMCNVMGPSAVQLVFTPRAGLGNPTSSGSYRVTATHASRAFSAPLTISAR